MAPYQALCCGKHSGSVVRRYLEGVFCTRDVVPCAVGSVLSSVNNRYSGVLHDAAVVEVVRSALLACLCGVCVCGPCLCVCQNLCVVCLMQSIYYNKCHKLCG